MTTEFKKSPAEAVKYLKSIRGQGFKFFLMVGQQAPIADQPGMCFPILGSINVGRQQAIDFIQSSYSTLGARGALVSLSEGSGCIFIG